MEIKKRSLYLLVLVVALGYFIDIYDVFIFSIIRIPSLATMGINTLDKNLLFKVSDRILSYQMVGFLIGGIFWGILGDKKGRINILFFTISLYSLCMIITSFIKDVSLYAWIRGITCFALAGEFGISITVVLESFSIQKREFASGIVIMFGALGVFVAYILSKLDLSWEWLYRVGGIFGFVLLLLRLSVQESYTYIIIKNQSHISKGNLLLIIKKGERLVRYIALFCLSWGGWFIAGILISLIDNFITYPDAKKLKIEVAVLFFQVGVSIGNIFTAHLSKWLKSRKKAMVFCFLLQAIGYTMYFTPAINHSPLLTYFICLILGFSGGYWAILHIMATEQFGTNIRSTVTNTISNFARSSLLISLWFITTIGGLSTYKLNKYIASEIWAVVTIILSFVALYFIKETYGKNLNFVEE